MCTFIGVECLAVNALIELYGEDIRRISFKELADFGLMVVEQYKKESGQAAVLIFDPDDIQGLVFNYSEYFDIEQEGDMKYLCLRDGCDILEIKKQFRWTLSYSMIKALNQVSVMTAMHH